MAFWSKQIRKTFFIAMLVIAGNVAICSQACANEPLNTEYEWLIEDMTPENDFEINGLRITDTITIGELKTPYNYSYGVMMEQPSSILKIDLESIEFYYRF